MVCGTARRMICSCAHNLGRSTSVV
jgi:hypothetical protein